jgi:3-phenylpropionate/trans-cinnamate dioxygenase ferredoxin subunit
MTEPVWRVACPLDDVASDDVLEVAVGDDRIAIIRTSNDRVFAVDAVCTHGRASLADGFVDGLEIECPKHNGRFNVETGVAVASPARTPVRTYPCRISGGSVEVQY